MKHPHRLAFVSCLFLSVAGCGDSWNSLNQMEKNVQNEVADILSKVQDEASAKLIVTDTTEKVKNKWEAVKKRKEKYLKSQFLNTLQDRIDKMKQAEPELTMDQVIERLKSAEPPVKQDQLNDIRNKLSLASDADHRREVAAIGERIARELARINRLPEEPANENVPKGPPGKMGGGSYIKQALQVPAEIFGLKKN